MMITNPDRYKAIAFNLAIQPPVALCCWKHHLNFIVNQICELEGLPDRRIFFENIISSIGGSLLDMYTGDLTPVEIANEIINHPSICQPICYESFSQWIVMNGKEYQCLTICDGSRWALRIGHYPNRFIHIHPGRNSTHTYRYKSTNLRTALAYLLLFGWNETNYSNLMLNKAREFAKLPLLGDKIEPIGTIKILNSLRAKYH